MITSSIVVCRSEVQVLSKEVTCKTSRVYNYHVLFERRRVRFALRVHAVPVYTVPRTVRFSVEGLVLFVARQPGECKR